MTYDDDFSMLDNSSTSQAWHIGDQPVHEWDFQDPFFIHIDSNHQNGYLDSIGNADWQATYDQGSSHGEDIDVIRPSDGIDFPSSTVNCPSSSTGNEGKTHQGNNDDSKRPHRSKSSKTIGRKKQGEDSEEVTKTVGDVQLVQRMQPTDFIRSLGPEWIQYFRIYQDVEPQISRHKARYRVFSRLTENIAADLISGEQDKVDHARVELAERKKKADTRRHGRKILEERIQAHFQFKCPKSASNVVRQGLTLFPKSRLDELQSTDESVYIPAFRLLQRLASQVCYEKTKNCPSRNKSSEKVLLHQYR